MPPPLPPTNLGFPLNSPNAPILIELYLDLICPFSMKVFCTTYDNDIFKAYDGKVSFVLHNVPQPWHPQGVYVHEVALAVKAKQPELYAKVVRGIYKAFNGGLPPGKFTDEDTWNKSRAQIYSDLLDVVAAEGADRSLIEEMVKINTLKTPAGDVQATTPMTQGIKWAVKFQRKQGVHVTPTCFVNGLEADVISSGWTADQWKAFLEPLGADNFTGSKLA